MDRLVYYSEGQEPEIVQTALSGMDVIVVYSQRRLLESLVDDPLLVGAVISVVDLEAWAPLLRSLSRSFPFLPLLVIRPAETIECPDGFTCVSDDISDGVLRDTVNRLVSAGSQRDRRQHHRFGWPLQARIIGADETVHRISEISAGGAYLEPAASSFTAGQPCELEIRFQNFCMKARCVVLDPRHMSSGRSAGFGVRFDGLSDAAIEFIDRIVNDALIAVLIDSSASPEIPSIDEEDDLLSIGDEFSLM